MTGGLARVLVFCLALAALFAAAATLGRAVGPLQRGSADPEAHADGAHRGTGPPRADGLAVADGVFRLVAAETTLLPGRPSSLAFRVVANDGVPLRSYDVEHARRLHLILVRRDLTGFRHLHPTLNANGTWAARLPALSPGAYRAFADFTTSGRKRVLGLDLLVRGSWAPRALPSPSSSGRVGRYRIALRARRFAAGPRAKLAFNVSRAGRPVRVGRYLGARGHLVVLREGDLAYLHTHARESGLEFETTFPSAGRYRAFLQFAHGARVHTVPFTLEVAA